MLFFLLSLYPLYNTIECVRGWNRVKKERFQHWLTYWLLYILCGYVYNIVATVWLLNYLLLLYQWFCVFFLLYCYFPQGSLHARRYILLPMARDFKRIVNNVYPYIYPFIQMGMDGLQFLTIYILNKLK